MMKYQVLHKQLVKISIIALVVVFASAAVAAGIYAWSSSLDDEVQAAQSKVNTARSELTSREEKTREAKQYLDLYKQITGTSEKSKLSDLDRDKAQLWISGTAKKLDLINLEGSFEPIAPIASPAFQKKTLQGIVSKVTLKFSAMTDEQLYRFIEAISTGFPGYIKIEKLEVQKKGEITDDVLRSAGAGKFPALVDGMLEFNWIGIKEASPQVNENAGQQP